MTSRAASTIDRNQDHVAMNGKNKASLAERVTEAAEASLAAQGYASPTDILLRIG